MSERNKGIKKKVDKDVKDVPFEKNTQWLIAETDVIARQKSTTA